jgi:hypothetical protein
VGVIALWAVQMNKGTTGSAASSSQSGGIKIAYVNIDTLEAHYDLLKTRKEEFKAKQEQMEIGPVLGQILAKWLGGTGRGILGALHRLKLEQTSWTNSRDSLRACGILDAYLSGNPQWDLRHRTLRTALACESLFPEINPQEMACYTLIRTASLCEHSVAQYMDQTPGHCYVRANQFADLRRTTPSVAQAHHQFVELVLDRLLR